MLMLGCAFPTHRSLDYGFSRAILSLIFVISCWSLSGKMLKKRTKVYFQDW